MKRFSKTFTKVWAELREISNDKGWCMTVGLATGKGMVAMQRAEGARRGSG